MCTGIEEIVAAVGITLAEIAAAAAEATPILVGITVGLELGSLLAACAGSAELAQLLGNLAQFFGIAGAVVGGVGAIGSGASGLLSSLGAETFEGSGLSLASAAPLAELTNAVHLIGGIGELLFLGICGSEKNKHSEADCQKAQAYFGLVNGMFGGSLELAGGNVSTIGQVRMGLGIASSEIGIGLMEGHVQGVGARLFGIGSEALGLGLQLADPGVQLPTKERAIGGVEPQATAVTGLEGAARAGSALTTMTEAVATAIKGTDQTVTGRLFDEEFALLPDAPAGETEFVTGTLVAAPGTARPAIQASGREEAAPEPGPFDEATPPDTAADVGLVVDSPRVTRFRTEHGTALSIFPGGSWVETFGDQIVDSGTALGDAPGDLAAIENFADPNGWYREKDGSVIVLLPGKHYVRVTDEATGAVQGIGTYRDDAPPTQAGRAASVTGAAAGLRDGPSDMPKTLIGPPPPPAPLTPPSLASQLAGMYGIVPPEGTSDIPWFVQQSLPESIAERDMRLEPPTLGEIPFSGEVVPQRFPGQDQNQYIKPITDLPDYRASEGPFLGTLHSLSHLGGAYAFNQAAFAANTLTNLASMPKYLLQRTGLSGPEVQFLLDYAGALEAVGGAAPGALEAFVQGLSAYSDIRAGAEFAAIGELNAGGEARLRYLIVEESERIFRQQRLMGCGPACGRTMLRDRLGLAVSERAFVDAMGSRYSPKTGCSAEDSAKAMTELAEGNAEFAGGTWAVASEEQMLRALRDISARNPVVVAVKDDFGGHFLIVESVDDLGVHVLDPWGASGPGKGQFGTIYGAEGVIETERFMSLWRRRLFKAVWQR